MRSCGRGRGRRWGSGKGRGGVAAAVELGCPLIKLMGGNVDVQQRILTAAAVTTAATSAAAATATATASAPDAIASAADVVNRHQRGLRLGPG